MTSFAHRVACRLPIVGKRIQRWIECEQELQLLNPGHFYSPILSPEDIKHHIDFDVGQERRIQQSCISLPGISLDVSAQQKLLADWSQEGCFQKTDAPRYSGNEYFQQMDAEILQAAASAFRPRRIVEIGSGYSSLAILDSFDCHQLQVESYITIDPFPDRLLQQMRPADRERVQIIDSAFQKQHLSLLQELGADDLLIVDSSHVYKPGSDVALLFDEAYSLLAPGVVLHIHDIFFPFSYPASWLHRGHHYNEAYLLRAFLHENPNFEVLLWNDLLKHLENVDLPNELCTDRDDIACSIWLRRRTIDSDPPQT